jgi:SPP1 family predicted phage head-tail adaptor
MTGHPSDNRLDRFHVAEMRDKINIQSATETLDDHGQPIRTWSNSYYQLPAKWMPVAGSETIRGRSVEAGIATMFIIRHAGGITPEMRVVHDSGTYGIGYVKPIGGRQRYIELHCKQAVA